MRVVVIARRRGARREIGCDFESSRLAGLRLDPIVDHRDDTKSRDGSRSGRRNRAKSGSLGTKEWSQYRLNQTNWRDEA